MKTRQQLHKDVTGSKPLELPELGRAYYRGCSPVVTGNATRAVVRFSIYNWATKFMADKQGQVSAPQVVIAGMFTGIIESFVVVPFESIKTTMVERATAAEVPQASAAANKPNIMKAKVSPVAASTSIKASSHGKPVRPAPAPASTPAAVRPPAPKPSSSAITAVTPLFGLGPNVRDMYKTRGLRSFFQGVWPTVFRQASNSAVKFSVYHFLKQLVHPNDSEKLPTYMALTLGGLTGAVQVLATQPIDVVKTRMQSINGLKIYRTSLHCGLRIFAEEGPLKLWTGLVPRFIKVTFSGAIVFAVYEMTNGVVSKAMGENPFASN